MENTTETRILERKVTAAEAQEILERIPELLDRIEMAQDDKKRSAKEFGELLKRLDEELGQNRHANRTGFWTRAVECEWRGDVLVATDTDEVVDVSA